MYPLNLMIKCGKHRREWQHFYRRMTQGNYSSNYNLPQLDIKIGILIKIRCTTFFHNGRGKKAPTGMVRHKTCFVLFNETECFI